MYILIVEGFQCLVILPIVLMRLPEHQMLLSNMLMMLECKENVLTKCMQRLYWMKPMNDRYSGLGHKEQKGKIKHYCRNNSCYIGEKHVSFIDVMLIRVC